MTWFQLPSRCVLGFEPVKGKRTGRLEAVAPRQTRCLMYLPGPLQSVLRCAVCHFVLCWSNRKAPKLPVRLDLPSLV